MKKHYIANQKYTEAHYDSLPKKYYFDKCILPQRKRKKSTWDWIGCDMDKDCLSRLSRYENGFQGGDWLKS